MAGSGFNLNEAVNLYANSTGANLLGTKNADVNGSLSVTARAHPAPYGPNSVVAVGQNSGKLAVAPFFMTPRLIMNPRTAPTGATIAAQGFGFGPEEEVNVWWNIAGTSFILALGTVVTDTEGSFWRESALTFTVPANAPSGINAVIGKGRATKVSVKAYVDVQ